MFIKHVMVNLDKQEKWKDIWYQNKDVTSSSFSNHAIEL
jgi:hypothetical protein